MTLLLVTSVAAAVLDQVLPEEEYACLSDLLGHGLGSEAKQAVIADLTTGDPSLIVGGDLPIEARALALNTKPELLREWAKLNEQNYPVLRQFHLPLPYTLLTESERDLLFRGDNPVAGWKLFFVRFPGSPGLLRVSRVAFDTAKTHALLYLELQCGAECGTGRLLQATRAANGPWQIEFGELIWIAGPKT